MPSLMSFLSRLPGPGDADRQRASEAARILFQLLGDDPPGAMTALHDLSPHVFDLSPRAARAFGALLIERVAATRQTAGRPGGGSDAPATETRDEKALRDLADLLGQAANLLTQMAEGLAAPGAPRTAEASPTPPPVTEDQRRALAELVAEVQDLGFGY